MSVKVISFANQKGGVGKSTLCLQMAFFLTEMGKKVLVVDMDTQGNTSSRLATKIELDDGSEEYVYSGTPSSALFSAEKFPITAMACPAGMDLIHAPRNDPDLAEVEQQDFSIVTRPAQNLDGFIQSYDYVLIDCPPALGRKLAAALCASTHVVCPVKLSGFAVDGVEDILTTIIGIRETANPNLELVGFVINDMDRSVSHERALQQLEENVPDVLLKNKIMHRPPLDSATTAGMPVWKLTYAHVAAKEVRDVMSEIMERVG